MPKQDKIDPKQVEEDYGLSMGLFKSSKELYGLLKKATRGNWTATKFQVELRNTNWFKKHSATWRENQALKFSDPQTFRSNVKERQVAINDLARSYGVSLSAATLKKMATVSTMNGFDDARMRDWIANYVKPSKQGNYGGELAGLQAQLEQTAARNGVRIGGPAMKSWMQAITRGNQTVEGYQAYLRDQAAKTFSAFGDQIRGGMDLQDVVSPYVNSMAEILEINPQQIDMFDQTIRKAITQKNAKGQVSPAALGDFEDSLRKDPRWRQTKNANKQARAMAAAMANAWGLK